MKLAIIKPDHIGDLVLSSAAVRALTNAAGSATLFVASGCLSLARHLFGGLLDIRAMDFPHLSKAGNGQLDHIDLREFGMTVFLRHDNVINPAWAELRCLDYQFPFDNNDLHQTALDYGVVAPLVGGYDVDALHFGAKLEVLKQKAVDGSQSVGLCIGSGYHANAWPVFHWLALGRRLIERNQSVSIVCGPSETGLGAALSRQLGLPPDRLIIGGADIATFLDRVGELDWVVASDGGAGHLCSLVAPVLSVFGPSPFRRYAPFGRWNGLLTRDLACSPCCQWASRAVNGCLSVECLGGIGAEDVDWVLNVRYATASEPGRIRIRDDLSIYEGVSHLDLSYRHDIGRETERLPQAARKGQIHHAQGQEDAGPTAGVSVPDKASGTKSRLGRGRRKN